MMVAKNWIHVAENCRENSHLAVAAQSISHDTFILQQNKCVNVKAPFIYVFFGQHTVFVQDTGATESTEQFPLYATIRRLIAERGASHSGDKLNILVPVSHSHFDHTMGDEQFRGQEHVKLVVGELEAVVKYFGFDKWSTGAVVIDLGGRELSLFAIPGHQEASIAVYEPRTQWLLTGDTFYPGRGYVHEWDEYETSIQKLVDFTGIHPVTALMCTLIEARSTAG
jgi:glyoxylase-like metal-dependent hydrolase (beta-lactamase superfamily II)